MRIDALENRELLTAVGSSTTDGNAAEGTDANYRAWEISRSGALENPCSISFQRTFEE
ncbi:MAG: hypothetical protein IK077_10560 [Thermoguttaceae bacterium]|nr:hypothetical protein [Thermoguttaceae bacterium]